MWLALLIPLIWAVSVLCAQASSLALDPFAANFCRFVLMAVIIVPLLGRRHHRLQTLRFHGLTLGASFLLYLCLLCTNLALMATSVAKTTFYGALYCLLIPLTRMLMGVRYKRRIFVVILLAFLGGSALTGFQLQGFGLGELNALASALLYALYVIMLGQYGRELKSLSFTVWQSLYLAFISLLFLWAFHSGSPLAARELIARDVLAVLIAWALLSLLAYWLQAVVQKTLSSARLGFVMTLDAPMASLLAWPVLGQEPVSSTLLGGGLILLTVALVPWLVKEEGREDERPSSCQKSLRPLGDSTFS